MNSDLTFIGALILGAILGAIGAFAFVVLFVIACQWIESRHHW
jgi:hypothetical protein